MSTSHIDGELVEDRNGKWLWRTADGVEIPVEQMGDNHLRNAAMFLMGMGYRKCIASQQSRVVWLTVFRTEWERRMLARRQEKQRREETIEELEGCYSPELSRHELNKLKE